MGARGRAATASKRDSLRANIILLRSRGNKQADVAKELRVSVACVTKWFQRFEREGLAGPRDAKGRARKPSIPAATVEMVIVKATRPPKPRQRWSVRTMAEEAGISPDSASDLESQ